MVRAVEHPNRARAPNGTPRYRLRTRRIATDRDGRRRCGLSCGRARHPPAPVALLVSRAAPHDAPRPAASPTSVPARCLCLRIFRPDDPAG
eukprot:7076894-Prymnesium_polylepis.1